MQPPRGRQQAHNGGEHDEQHHPRLQQGDPVGGGGGGEIGVGRGQGHGFAPALAHQHGGGGVHRAPQKGHASAQRNRGSSAKVWNGGGELRVHSSVVAPSPQ